MSFAFWPGLICGYDLAARHPEPAGGVEVHLNRLGQQRIGGEQVDLETVGDLQRLALDLRVGIGHLGIALGEDRRTNHRDTETQRRKQN